MNTPSTGLVLGRQQVLAISSGLYDIWLIGIACDARRVVNFGGKFVLREGGAFRLMK